MSRSKVNIPQLDLQTDLDFPDVYARCEPDRSPQPGESLRLASLELDPTKLVRLLLEAGSVSRALRLLGEDWMELKPVIKTRLAENSASIVKQLEEIGATFCERNSLPFPLADSSDPLLGLFVQGELPPTPGVAVVGTRKTTGYGRRLAEQIGRRLSRLSVPVISGLARGIDAAAHHGVVATGGVGVAVLGSGIGRWYPTDHQELGEGLIAGGGAVVSEYPPGSIPFGWRFLHRNRLIAGLSEVVIVVEAPERSGALTTARIALEGGKDVLVIPGDIDRETSRGTNRLIQEGAHPILDLDDLEEMVIRRMEITTPQSKTDNSTGREETSDPLLSQIPETGISLEELVKTPDQIPQLLSQIGHLSAQGKVQWEGDLVYRL